jgi:hypothetical protein
MTHKSLLPTVAATFLVVLSSSAAQSGECLRETRMESRLTTAVHRVDAMFRRVGDRLVRTGDRLLGRVHRTRS